MLADVMFTAIVFVLTPISHVLVSLQEALILKKLKFRLNVPTTYVFMLRFLKAAQSANTWVWKPLESTTSVFVLTNLHATKRPK